MTTPKEALEQIANVETSLDKTTLLCQIATMKRIAAEALASLQGEDAVERVARTICQSGKFETGQGTCAVICMDQLGDVRKKGCGHCTRVHGAMARAILVTGLVPDETALKTKLTEAEWLIRELCGHEGAEGFSEYLNKRLEAYEFTTQP